MLLPPRGVVMAEADIDSTGAAKAVSRSVQSAHSVSRQSIDVPAAPALSQGFGGDRVEDIVIRSLLHLSCQVEYRVV